MIMATVCIQMHAQENAGTDFNKSESYDMPLILQPVSDNLQPSPTTCHPSPVTQYADSLHLPAMDSYGHVGWGGMYPFYLNGLGQWDLHSGLNVSLSASVFTSFGKSRYGGSGFSQNISAMYAVPVTDRLSLAVGGYFTNTIFGHNSFRDAGLSAVLGYRFNDHWEAFVYGQKSLIDKKMPLPFYYYMNNVGDRIGAAVRYSPNHSFSVTVSFEGRSDPSWIPAHPFGGKDTEYPYGGIEW